MALALEFVIDLVTEERLGDTAEGRFLANRVARLIDACTLNMIQATKTGMMHKRFAQSAGLVMAMSVTVSWSNGR